ncbi:hypothetical protein FB451DRAFT_1187812 [Mycena latifolia]|nr:hypothetical protein FB451DRAFT_1187812 [Mycena latifolia]
MSDPVPLSAGESAEERQQRISNRAFLQLIRELRHLMMLKRWGRGHMAMAETPAALDKEVWISNWITMAPEPETPPTERESSPSLEEKCRIDAEERELKKEVLTLGPQGPISKAAREWLSRNQAILLRTADQELGPLDLVTAEERQARVAKLMEIRAAGLAKIAEAQREREERRQGNVELVTVFK